MTGNDAQRIEVQQDNALGVTTLEVSRFAANGDDVFELRGFDAADDQLALVRLRIGAIDGLSDVLPGAGNVGSEITMSVAGSDTRMVTRERELFRLDAVEGPAIQQFLELSAVASTLESEAHIIVASTALADADPSEVALTALSCTPSNLLTSPVAQQCCYGHTTWNLTGGIHTWFINASNQSVKRQHNTAGGGAGCKATDGVSACAGSSCFFGPNGFGRPIVTDQPPGYPYPKMGSYTDSRTGTSCKLTWYTTPQTLSTYYVNTTGTFPRTQGCPGGATGDGEWDY